MRLNGMIKKIAQLTIGIMLFTSCARQISSDVYSARQVGEVSTTIPGYVRNVREVCMEQGEQLQENEVGIAGGGVAGGVVGHAIGRGRFVPTAVGAIAGAISGAFIEKKLKEQLALEYIIQLDNGSLITVVQGKDYLFTIGQPVYVIVSQSGRSRLIPQ